MAKQKAKRIILIAAACAMLFSISAFAYGAEFLFTFNVGTTGSKESEKGTRIKPSDGDPYAYVTCTVGTALADGTENNMIPNHATVTFRVRDFKGKYATEYKTISYNEVGDTKKLKYLNPSADIYGEPYRLYANLESTERHPVYAVGRWVP